MSTQQVTKDTPPGTRVLVTRDDGTQEKRTTLSWPCELGQGLFVFVGYNEPACPAPQCEVLR